MSNRLKLHGELVTFSNNVYFQPPSNISLTYPCIIYQKNGKQGRYADDDLYSNIQRYNLTVIDKDPDSVIADNIEKHFGYCKITDNFTTDNLNHTSLSLYY